MKEYIVPGLESVCSRVIADKGIITIQRQLWALQPKLPNKIKQIIRVSDKTLSVPINEILFIKKIE